MTGLRERAVDLRRRSGKAVRRFARDGRGIAAVEFAIVAVPFFGILFAILETALVFFVGQILDTAVTQAARQIRTGQVQQAGMSAADFKTIICDGMAGFGDCDGNLYVDVVRYTDFSSITLGSPVNADGEIDPDDLSFQPGARGEVVVVRGFYEWPVFFNLLQTSTLPLASGNYLLSAAIAFRNEPFPW